MSGARDRIDHGRRLDARLHRFVHVTLRRRMRDQRGASLVEYALIFATVVTGSVGATKYLSTQAGSQVANQANCVAVRPPATLSSGCVLPAVTASTTTTIAPTTSGPTTSLLPTTTSTIAPTTTSATATATNPTGSTVANCTSGPGKCLVGTSITITKSPSGTFPSTPTVTFAYREAGGSIQTVTVTCSGATSPVTCTLPNGVANLQFSSGSVQVWVQSINANPTPPRPTGTQTVTF